MAGEKGSAPKGKGHRDGDPDWYESPQPCKACGDQYWIHRDALSLHEAMRKIVESFCAGCYDAKALLLHIQLEAKAAKAAKARQSRCDFGQGELW